VRYSAVSFLGVAKCISTGTALDGKSLRRFRGAIRQIPRIFYNLSYFPRLSLMVLGSARTKSCPCSARAAWARSNRAPTKPNRDVALKVLPEAFTLDPDRLARFKREAQVLASLNHPKLRVKAVVEPDGRR
jgi:serine/threonine protein kinase